MTEAARNGEGIHLPPRLWQCMPPDANQHPFISYHISRCHKKVNTLYV